MTLKHIGIVGCSAPGAALCHQTICTEIPLLLRPEDMTLPLLDSTRLLARAALRKSLQT